MQSAEALTPEKIVHCTFYKLFELKFFFSCIHIVFGKISSYLRKWGFVFLLLSLFMCIVWNAFFNVCLLVNSLIRCLKFFSFLWSILALSLSGAFFRRSPWLASSNAKKKFSNSKIVNPNTKWICIYESMHVRTTFWGLFKVFDGSRFITAHHQCRMFVFSGVRF